MACCCICPPPPGTNGSTWNNWGTFTDRSGSVPEPNQLTGGENCVMANFTMSSNSTPTEIGAWGWADVNCGFSFTLRLHC